VVTRLPRSVYVLQSGLVLNAFGNGAANPFVLLYLHDVRGIPLAAAGLASAANAGCALVASLVGGMDKAWVTGIGQDADWWLGYWDESRLQQVLVNLLSNAIKYSPESGEIAVTLTTDAALPEIAIINVRDHGIGIPARDLPLLFTPFHRGANVGSVSGTGLGLAISKQLIELMGGTIQAESEIGKGSTFSFALTLPFGVQTFDVPVSRSILVGLRALIVDDSEINRRVVQEQILSCGMRTGSFAAAQQALEAAMDHRRPGASNQDVEVARGGRCLRDLVSFGDRRRTGIRRWRSTRRSRADHRAPRPRSGR